MAQQTQPQVNAQGQTVQPALESSNKFILFLQNSISFFNKNRKITLSILSLLGMVIFVRAVFFKPAIISVVGTGVLTAKPVQVEMLVTKVDSNPDSVLAIMAGEESINNIVQKAKELAGDDVKVQKSFYQVTPTVVAGDVLYQVVNVFKITAQDPSKTTDIIKGFYASGATTVSGVSFIPENQDKVVQDARKAAIKDAKKQARNIARASGKIVGRIVSIGDDLSRGNSTVSTDGASDSGTDLSAQVNYVGGVPTEIDVSKSMTVTYEIW